MHDDLTFEVCSDYTEDDPLPPKEATLIIREVGDFELRFFFNPSRFNIKKVDILLPHKNTTAYCWGKYSK